MLFVSGRRDKYQRKIFEYWVDVETVGSLSKTQSETFNQTYEIVDPNAELPAPGLGSSTDPNLGASDDDDEEESSDDDVDDKDEEPLSTEKKKKQPKKKKKKSSPTPSPKNKSRRSRSVLTRSKRKEKPSKKDTVEYEEALQAGNLQIITIVMLTDSLAGHGPNPGHALRNPQAAHQDGQGY